MKIIKEDIENLERYIGNAKVGVHTDLPIVMADAYEDSKKRQEEIDKEIEEKNKNNVELNKVVGAEKQPVPNLPEEAKVNLEESLFEDYDADVRHYSDILFDMIEEGALDAADIAKDLIYWCSEDDIKRYMEVNQLIGEFIDDDEEEEIEEESLTEDTEEDKYYAALDIPKGPERKKVAAERRQEFLKKYDLQDRAKEWKDAKGKDDPEEEEDLFTRINDELFPYDMEIVKTFTKLPDIPASKRYHQGDIGIDYDGNILVYADEDEDFDFAKQVADAYGVDITEPRQQGKHKVVRISIPA